MMDRHWDKTIRTIVAALLTLTASAAHATPTPAPRPPPDSETSPDSGGRVGPRSRPLALSSRSPGWRAQRAQGVMEGLEALAGVRQDLVVHLDPTFGTLRIARGTALSQPLRPEPGAVLQWMGRPPLRVRALEPGRGAGAHLLHHP